MVENLTRKQIKGIIGITTILFGILVFPILIERMFGYDAVSVAFVVIVFYAGLNYYMKNYR